ncbi:MAG TPA: ethanolamine ammonia-lyase subunit EutC [Prolixibacteraceae bacterium]|nr:ethanolamine ammonia-lyase subunit EutC [Prolixibacteraceae bacterium]
MKNENSVSQKALIQEDSWSGLKEFTKARIALGNVGGSMPVREVLSLKLAHAGAKDAIYSGLDINSLQQKLTELNIPVFELNSRIEDRLQYLKRPDLGRRLNEKSSDLLKNSGREFDIIFAIADGLSAEAVNLHAFEVLKLAAPQLATKYKIAVALVNQGRVAIGDEIGELLKAKFTAVMIGERPGLSSHESMGIYTTYSPAIGLTDERRNCISNIHPDGLSYVDATRILLYLTEQSFVRKISGVEIKLELGQLSSGETEL